MVSFLPLHPKTKMNWKGYKLGEGRKPGDKEKGKVTGVEETTWRKYLTAKGKIGNIGSFEKPDDAQVLVRVEGADKVIAEDLLSMPKDGKEVAPNSNLGKYMQMYNKLPEVGDNVELMADKKGFWKLFVGL